jgi:hypothetical protein
MEDNTMLGEQSKVFTKVGGLLLLSAMVLGFATGAYAQEKTPPVLAPGLAAMQITMTGFRANEGGGGALSTGWVTGNLGNTWSEGEWVPYQMIIDNIEPGLAELDSIVLSYDFFRASGSTEARFVDLVRGVQVGSAQLLDTQGWPKPDMTPYPLGTRAELEIAQSAPGENKWPGFTFLNLPNSQINRADSDAGADTFPGEDEHTIRIFKSDLLAAGVDANATTVIIYFQLHESRSFIWENGLQAGYDQPPTDAWGGYLYSQPTWPGSTIFGAGYVPGASGHVRLETQSGNKEVPIPIPERLPGAVSGLKWLDTNGNGMQDGLEPALSGWEIHVFGNIDQIDFTTSTMTDESGNYSFPSLTNGLWTVKEDSQRDVPPEIGYTQTYPLPGTIFGQGTGVAVAPPPADAGDNGWDVELTLTITEQADMNFGNRACDLMCNASPADTTVCSGGTATFTDNTTGGTPPYSYCWEQGPAYVGACLSTQSSLVIPNAQLSDDGIYRVITSDANGCADTCFVSLTVPESPDCSIDGVSVTCLSVTNEHCGPIGMTTYEWSITGNGTFETTPALDDDCVDVLAGALCDSTYTLTLTITNDDGCSSTCRKSVSVEDTEDPEIVTCPADTSVQCAGDVALPLNSWRGFVACGGAATDNCDSNLEATYDEGDPVGTCPTTIELTWTVTDDCDNTDTCVQTITIDDTMDPEITACAADTSVQCIEDIAHPLNSWTGFVASGGAATDNCDANLEATYEEGDPVGTCATTIELTWTIKDDCDNFDTCVQTITVDDTTAPVIETCPIDQDYECGPDPTLTANMSSKEDWKFPGATIQGFLAAGGVARDNCDEDLEASYVLSGPTGMCPKVWTLVWTVSDDCDNSDTCTQTITEDDTTPPSIACPDTLWFECDDIGDFGDPEVGDACDPAPVVTFMDTTKAGRCAQESTVVRTWTATDSCGNEASCSQVMMIQDTTPPTITYCAPDDTVDCAEFGGFTDPTAEDNCDPEPELVIVEEDTVAGAGPGEIIISRCWVAVDDCGNESNRCCQTLTVGICPCTYTQGGWGSGCPDPQVDREFSTQPGCIRDHFFDEVFPNGVTIGDPAGVGSGAANVYAAHWTTALAVENFLPAGGKPRALTGDVTDPTDTPAGVLAGQILALTMNREYSCAGVFSFLGLIPYGNCLGGYVIPDACGSKFAGLTVDEFLAVANMAIGGDDSALDPYHANLSHVNFTATCLNEKFDNCEVSYPQGERPAAETDGPPEGVELVPSFSMAPVQFTVPQAYPNPFTRTCNIRFGLPRDGRVLVEVFDVAGRRVVGLHDDNKPAGFHAVTWDGKNSSGSRVASGIYFYRVKYEDKAEIKKMIMLQ